MAANIRRKPVETAGSGIIVYMSVQASTVSPGSVRGRGNFLKDIHGKSDRAVAVVGAALLNAHAEQLLTSHFIQDGTEIEALMGNDRSLGTFGARIRIAYLLGLISKEEFEDLWSVNLIDEAFGRELGNIDFSDEPIQTLCLDLRIPNKILLLGEKHTPRRMYVFAVALLLRQLALRIESAERNQRRSPAPFLLVEVKK